MIAAGYVKGIQEGGIGVAIVSPTVKKSVPGSDTRTETLHVQAFSFLKRDCMLKDY